MQCARAGHFRRQHRRDRVRRLVDNRLVVIRAGEMRDALERLLPCGRRLGNHRLHRRSVRHIHRGVPHRGWLGGQRLERLEFVGERGERTASDEQQTRTAVHDRVFRNRATHTAETAGDHVEAVRAKRRASRLGGSQINRGQPFHPALTAPVGDLEPAPATELVAETARRGLRIRAGQIDVRAPQMRMLGAERLQQPDDRDPLARDRLAGQHLLRIAGRDNQPSILAPVVVAQRTREREQIVDAVLHRSLHGGRRRNAAGARAPRARVDDVADALSARSEDLRVVVVPGPGGDDRMPLCAQRVGQLGSGAVTAGDHDDRTARRAGRISVLAPPYRRDEPVGERLRGFEQHLRGAELAFEVPAFEAVAQLRSLNLADLRLRNGAAANRHEVAGIHAQLGHDLPADFGEYCPAAHDRPSRSGGK